MAATTYKDLMAMIGNLLVAWGQTETALNDALADLPIDNTTLAGAPFAKRVDVWQAELVRLSENYEVRANLTEWATRLAEIRQLRNLICHHLRSARAASEDGPEPFAVVSKDGRDQAIPYSDIEQAHDDLVRYRHEFARILDVAREHPGQPGPQE